MGMLVIGKDKGVFFRIKRNVIELSSIVIERERTLTLFNIIFYFLQKDRIWS
jgi:hypothetical protein